MLLKKVIFFIASFFIIAIQINAQTFHFTPNNYNSFITKPNISWAAEAGFTYDLANVPFKNYKNVYEYLITQKKTGKIKFYITKEINAEYDSISKIKKNSDIYLEVDSSFENKFQLNNDSINGLQLQQIFYIENHKLKTYTIGAALQYPIYLSSGYFLGNTISSYNSISKKYNYTSKKKDDVVFLKTIYKVFNFDSLESTTNLKKTFGMTLAQTLWYDLSQGYNEVTDLKTNLKIPAENVMDYESAFDTFTITRTIDTVMVDKQVVNILKIKNILSHIGISQNWYYNRTKNIFFSKIDETYFYISYRAVDGLLNTHKRFKISFK